MAKLSEKHPREAEIAKKVLEPFRTVIHSPNPTDDIYLGHASIRISKERADDLEMKICEALVEAYCRGVEAP